VTFRERLLFDPAWGTYDMAVGKKIISAFSGPADSFAFDLEYPVPKEKTHKIIHSEKARRLHHLYQVVRDIRENKHGQSEIENIWKEVKEDYPEEWLLPLELLEIIKGKSEFPHLEDDIRNYLIYTKGVDPDIKRLIENGMMINKEV
jgi:phenylalanine-4-hydroxylase